MEKLWILVDFWVSSSQQFFFKLKWAQKDEELSKNKRNFIENKTNISVVYIFMYSSVKVQILILYVPF